VVAKSIERVADLAYSITDKAIKLKDKIPKGISLKDSEK
jgi:hypothetical protein